MQDVPRPARLGGSARLAALLAVLVSIAGAFAGPADPAGAGVVCPPGPTLEGIDVSHWQGAIDWTQVAGAGRTFAFAKASEGATYVDPTFATNFAGIRSAGMKAGAYQFFRPSHDAVTQANLFMQELQQVGYGAGDLLPVIDVEVTDNLPLATVRSQLQAVVSAVTNGLGVAPVIYTSPYFWSTTLGTPPGFTSSPLWIANWGVACPTVPAPTWSTWAYWQYSSTGSVAGVTGAVDLDRFNGSALPTFTSKAPTLAQASPPLLATVGAPYTYSFWAAGSPTPTWSVASGALPNGLSLDPATGVLSGTPTTAGPATFTVQAANGVAPDAVSPSFTITVLPAPTGARFHPLVPARVLDSRTSVGGWGASRLAAGTPRPLVVNGTAGVPGTATSVVLNVTATNSTAGSFLTVYPAGTPQPNASNLNFGPFQTIPNLVTVKVGAGNQVMFANAVGSTDVVADVVGYFDDGTGPGDLFTGVTPARILDSRTNVGGWAGQKIGATDRDLGVAGYANVPATATAAVLNVTATNASAGSFLEVWPAGQPRPNASNLNFAAGQTIPNLVVVQLGTGGAVSFHNEVGATDVVVDVVGYFDPAAGGRYYPLPGPTRIVDDRFRIGITGMWTPGSSRPVVVGGANGIPAAAEGVVLNATATGGTAPSFLTIYPDAVALPNASNVNFGAGETIANLVMVEVPANGKVDVANLAGNVHVVLDAVGYYAP